MTDNPMTDNLQERNNPLEPETEIVRKDVTLGEDDILEDEDEILKKAAQERLKKDERLKKGEILEEDERLEEDEES